MAPHHFIALYKSYILIVGETIFFHALLLPFSKDTYPVGLDTKVSSYSLISLIDIKTRYVGVTVLMNERFALCLILGWIIHYLFYVITWYLIGGSPLPIFLVFYFTF